MEKEDSRTLKIEIPGCLVSSSTGLEWDILTGLNGWTLVPGYTETVFWEGTIDLSGYAREMKTFYPSAAFLQEGAFWALSAILPVTAQASQAYTIVSSVPLDVQNVVLQIAANSGPGFIDLNLIPTGQGQQDWNTVIFAESQVNVVNISIPTTTGILQPLSTKQSGSLAPTASDTLYVMKIVLSYPANGIASERYIGSSMSVPASRVIIPGKFGIEPDVEYMMRLKRSVELSQQV